MHATCAVQFYETPDSVLCAAGVSPNKTAPLSNARTANAFGHRQLAICPETLPAVRYVTIVYFRSAGTVFALGEVQASSQLRIRHGRQLRILVISMHALSSRKRRIACTDTTRGTSSPRRTDMPVLTVCAHVWGDPCMQVLRAPPAGALCGPCMLTAPIVAANTSRALATASTGALNTLWDTIRVIANPINLIAASADGTDRLTLDLGSSSNIVVRRASSYLPTHKGLEMLIFHV